MIGNCQAIGITFFTKSYQNIPNKKTLLLTQFHVPLKISAPLSSILCCIDSIFFIISLHLLQILSHIFLLELYASKCYISFKEPHSLSFPLIITVTGHSSEFYLMWKSVPKSVTMFICYGPQYCSLSVLNPHSPFLSCALQL